MLTICFKRCWERVKIIILLFLSLLKWNSIWKKWKNMSKIILDTKKVSWLLLPLSIWKIFTLIMKNKVIFLNLFLSWNLFKILIDLESRTCRGSKWEDKKKKFYTREVLQNGTIFVDKVRKWSNCQDLHHPHKSKQLQRWYLTMNDER